MKKLFAGDDAVLTFSGLAWAQAWNHAPTSPIGPLHWGTVTPSYATCGDSTTGEVGMKQSPIDIVPDNAPAVSFSAPLFKYKPTPPKIENTGHCRRALRSHHYLYVGSQPTGVYQTSSFIFMRQANTLSTASDMTRSFTWCTPMSLSLRLLPAPQLKPAPAA
jgi:carbonic anhydrase